MTVNPFVLGVCSTLFAEMAAVLIVALFINKRK